MIPIDDVLEALKIDRAEPSIQYLRALFGRFNQRIPFESASKILRDADVPDPADKPRWPEIFWADHLESGAGGTCFARVAAFQALLQALSFKSRPVLGRVADDVDHAALLVESAGEEWVCDVGFPLPAVLSLREGETDTALGNLRVGRTPRGFFVELLEGVPEGPRAVEIFDAPVPDPEFLARWRRTFRPDSEFLEAVSLRIERPGRIVSFAAGEIRVDDRHSRARIPLPAPREGILSETFGVDAAVLDRAFARVGDPEPAIAAAEIAVYLETDAEPAAAFAAVGSPEAYAVLLSGVARVSTESLPGGGWRARLSPAEAGDDSGSVSEEAVPDRGAFSLNLRRGSQESSYEVASRNGRTHLVRRLHLAGSRLDLLRNDSLRGRLAGTLAVDLLAWARRLAR
jgi:N-acetyltransferase